MAKPIPKLTKEDVTRILTAAMKEKAVPAPESVHVEKMEDQYGEDALRLVVVFPSNVPVEKAMWTDVKPFVEGLRDFLFEKDGEERFVYLKIIRMAEEPAIAE